MISQSLPVDGYLSVISASVGGCLGGRPDEGGVSVDVCSDILRVESMNSCWY